MSRKTFPEHGRKPAEIVDNLKDFRKHDADWKNGKVFCLIYYADEHVEQLSHEVYNLFLHENGLNPVSFPSIARCETETVAMVCDLLHGDDKTTGSVTSGGTESILLAVKAARERARDKQPHITKPNMVVPLSVHPAWEKAGHYFDVEVKHIGLDSQFRADVQELNAAVDDNTILVVGSAVNYPYGTIDPIVEMGKIAAERDICCHVDACVGGFMLPFLEDLGYPMQAWDFRIPGVTSISCDLHKYGYVPKGASTVLYRDASYRRYQYYVYADWPGGVYATPNMGGSRPAAPIATSWAVLQYLGRDGYKKFAKGIMETARRIQEGVNAIDGLHILGTPEMTVFSFGSDTLNTFELAEKMSERGWHLEQQQNPASIHMSITSARHADIVEPFLEDLRQCCKETAAMKPGESSGMAAVYGMLSTLPDRSQAKELSLNFLDQIFSI